MSALQREVLKKGFPPLPSQFNPEHTKSRFAGLLPKRKRKNYSPIDWNEYFEKSVDVKLGDNSFRLYCSGTRGPALVLLHGGGHSALSWALFTKCMLSMCHCQILAIDFRGHGHTRTTDDEDLNADVMAKDVGDVLNNYFVDAPPIVLLGHSMGGAIAVHVGVQNLIPTLSGLAVIDVVEGTALDALSAMQSFLRSRPKYFKSMEEAIEWSVRAGQIRNADSARVSMPGQIMRVPKNAVDQACLGSLHVKPVSTLSSGSIVEEDDEHGDILSPVDSGLATAASMEPVDDGIYTWRVDLPKTERFWEGWFRDMTRLFLSCPVPKLLILAGIDRLDKQMTVAQMQGKFQLQVLANCGHTVHEDQPDQMAEIVTGFLLRQRLTTALDEFQRHMPSC